MTTTTDLSSFGYREQKMAAELLTAYCNDIPDFLGDGVTIMMNSNSGYVFLTDEDYRVGMLEDGKIIEFVSCGNCGAEGLITDEDLGWNQHEGLCSECAGEEED